MNSVNSTHLSLIQSSLHPFSDVSPGTYLLGLTAIFTSIVFKKQQDFTSSLLDRLDEKTIREHGEVLSLSTFNAREVAKSLNVPNPGKFIAYAFTQETDSSMLAMMVGSSIILASSQMEQALRKDPAAKFTFEEARGVLAHEIGHATLGHHHPDHPQWKKFSQFDDLEYDPKDSASVEKWEELHFGSLRAQEREADFFTLKDPRLAKGLIHRLKRQQIGRALEIPSVKDSHPTDAERIAYLTDALCQPEGNNTDVCVEL